jgi:hypothetical protein
MAADKQNVDNVGFQQFPLISPSSIPSEEEFKEELYMRLNLKDGQQSATQSMEDPYTQAVKYIERHKIVEVFQKITARLAYEKPDDPIQFLLDEIGKIKQGDSIQDLK